MPQDNIAARLSDLEKTLCAPINAGHLANLSDRKQYHRAYKEALSSYLELTTEIRSFERAMQLLAKVFDGSGLLQVVKLASRIETINALERSTGLGRIAAEHKLALAGALVAKGIAPGSTAISLRMLTTALNEDSPIHMEQAIIWGELPLNPSVDVPSSHSYLEAIDRCPSSSRHRLANLLREVASDPVRLEGLRQVAGEYQIPPIKTLLILSKLGAVLSEKQSAALKVRIANPAISNHERLRLEDPRMTIEQALGLERATLRQH